MTDSSKDYLVIKIGGSAFDLGRTCIEPLCDSVLHLQRQSKFVLCVGGGPCLDFLKDTRDEYELTESQYQALSSGFIQVQAAIIERFIPETQLVYSNNLACIQELLEENIAPLVIPGTDWSYAQSPADTDFLALLVAEELKQTQVVFIKDTPGIYYECPQADSTPFAPPIERINTEELINTVSRVGADGRDEHLIEDSAVTFLSHSEYVKSVFFLNCREPASLQQFLQGHMYGSVLTAH